MFKMLLQLFKVKDQIILSKKLLQEAKFKMILYIINEYKILRIFKTFQINYKLLL